jgi:class 3 adenylate cyclase
MASDQDRLLRKLAAMLYADVAGYSRLTGEDEEGTHRVDRDDIYGIGVNVAARLESLATPGGIGISESVHSAIGNKLPLDFRDIGEQSVKNIARAVRAYEVIVTDT